MVEVIRQLISQIHDVAGVRKNLTMTQNAIEGTKILVEFESLQYASCLT